MPDARLISNAALWGLHTAEGRAEAVREWVRANNIDPNVVAVDRDLTVEDTPAGRIVRYTAFVFTRNGRVQFDPANPNRALMHERTVPLVVVPPADWPVYAVPGGGGVPS